MKAETKNKLLEAWQYCDDNDKSTGFMLEYMQDVANVDLDCVIGFIQKTTYKDRQKYLRPEELQDHADRTQEAINESKGEA